MIAVILGCNRSRAVAVSPDTTKYHCMDALRAVLAVINVITYLLTYLIVCTYDLLIYTG